MDFTDEQLGYPVQLSHKQQDNSEISEKIQNRIILYLFGLMFILALLSLISWLNYRKLFIEHYESKQQNQRKPSHSLVNPQFTPITKDLDMKIRRY